MDFRHYDRTPGWTSASGQTPAGALNARAHRERALQLHTMDGDVDADPERTARVVGRIEAVKVMR